MFSRALDEELIEELENRGYKVEKNLLDSGRKKSNDNILIFFLFAVLAYSYIVF